MKIRDILENIILVAIVLVIIQTFITELAVYMHWSVAARNVILVFGFVFDLIFTIEFITRSIISGRGKKVVHYWIYERGWVDFLSSLPLLLLDSGPGMFLLLTGAMHGESAIGVLNVLKVVKAVRVTRILRLVRIIKIFGKIHNAESKMAQHHTSTISTTAVFTIVCTLIIFSFFFDRSVKNEINIRTDYYTSVFNNIEKSQKGAARQKKLLENMFASDSRIISITYHKNDVIRNIDGEKFKKYYTFEDYITAGSKKINAQISIADIHSSMALNHMQSFFIIVLVVISFMVFYTRHFAQSISDIIHILNKGFRKKNYNLEVKIREEYSDEEIFRLAKFYNDAYLPSKLKRIQEQEQKKTSGLSMDDLKGFGQ